MNKYLEKAASLGEELGKVKKPEPVTAPGSKLIHGSKTLFQRALLKKAEFKSEVKTLKGEPESVIKDVVNTGVVGAAGGVTGTLTHKILHPNAPRGEGAKAFMLSTGLGLVGDYAAVKANNLINRHMDKVASLFPSVKYQKTLSEKEKKNYLRYYGSAPLYRPFQSIGSSLAIGAGVAGGYTAGSALAKPLSQKLANKLKDRGIISGKYRMADGSHNLEHILHDGIKVHRKMNAVLPITLAVLGAIPGMSLADRYRHNYAKSVVERNRNQAEKL